MFGTRWRLFRLAGIPISLDVSWLIILALITFTLREGFATEWPGQPTSEYWLMGLITALAFFVCIVLHELGHSVVARSLGMPIRGITLFLFGGVAELGGEPPSARAEFLMAIAGPVVSAVLAGVFWLLYGWGAQAGWPPAAELILFDLFWINLIVLLFNLVPAFPLDGGRVFRSILWGITGRLRQATRWASLGGQGFAWLLIIYGVLLLLAGGWRSEQSINALWLILIGIFLNSAARSTYQQLVLRRALQGEPIRQFMNPQPIVVPPSLDLRHWIEDYVYRYHRKTFPVASNGHLEGFISTQALNQLPREEWAQHTVGEVMRHDVRAISLPPSADALQALERMQRTGSSRLLVVEDDRLVGIISLKDLLRFFQLKIELGGNGPEG
jgi:Zn-dependent protease/CBS domain-containing protein